MLVGAWGNRNGLAGLWGYTSVTAYTLQVPGASER